MPYELTDLDKVDRTFYNISSQYLPLLSDIPMDVIEFTARMMDDIRPRLPYETSPNIVLTLADHIAFSLERAKKGIYIQMPSVYELEQNYPLEIKIGRRIVSAVERQFHIKLPKGEIQGIAMHFINARNEPTEPIPNDIRSQYEEVLEQTTQIIEWEMDIKVARDSFNYARFATHLQYLLNRLFEQQHVDSDNLQMYHSIREEYPAVAACVDKISDYYQNTWQVTLAEEEKLYLIMHINRVCAKETI
jgi:beta-glucoside operon transcriptional antiterminator